MVKSDLSPKHRSLRPAALALAGVLTATALTGTAAGETKDPQALADRLVEALGGQEAWQSARCFRFTFAGFRTHHWDRYSGRHRLEYTDREGDHWVVLENVQSREGRAWRNGEELSGEAAEKALEGAYAAWINDTYWLLAPYKLSDPGVHLAYDGEETLEGVRYDKLLLTFEDVGLTPGDRYWFYLDRETGLLDRWAYVLESFEEGQPATHWLWRDWQRHGGILLSAQRINPDSGRELPLADIAVPESMPDGVFESPEPLQP